MRTIPRIAMLGIATVAAGLLTPMASDAATPSAGPISGWTQVGHETQLAITADEGVATVHPPGKVYYTGVASVPADLVPQGWNHIGDPDSAAGYIVDAIQTSGKNATNAHAKLFRVTRPDGGHVDYVHQDGVFEATNNSWDAISADQQWMLSGEYGTMSRFLVYPTPLLNKSTPAAGGALPLVGQVTLDHAVRNVQGCDFVNPTRLLCSADDSGTDLFPTSKQLLQIDLSAAPTSGNQTGHVTYLGQLPLNSTCTGNFETEGIDYDAVTGKLRVIVTPPPLCGYGTVDVYTFQQN